MLKQSKNFRQNKGLHVLLVAYAALWLWMAVDPYSRFDWLLENLLIFAAVLGLAVTYPRFQFGNVSYTWIVLFLSLHTVGANYSYTTTPIDELLHRWFAFERDHYDRIVHFSFGLLLAYPVFECAVRIVKLGRAWAYVLVPMVILAFGAFYELIKMWVAQLVAPEIGTLFLGTQGDPWDTQHDMELALYGAIIAMTLTGLWYYWKRRSLSTQSGKVEGVSLTGR